MIPIDLQSTLNLSLGPGESFLNLVPQPFMALNAADVIIASNEEASKLFGFASSDDLLGKHLSEFFVDNDEVDNFNDFLSEYGCLSNWENTFVKADGSAFVASYMAASVTDVASQANIKLIFIRQVAFAKGH